MPQQEMLVLVDEYDRELGTESRERCHTGRGIRHRAYVVFLFHLGRLLMQRRSKEKLLWPGYWDVSYTSHVYPGETYFEAAARRGVQELRVKPRRLEEVFAFTYEAAYGKHSENEYCKLLVGEFNGKFRANPAEIMETKFVTLGELKDELRRNNPTPWLKLAFQGFLSSGVHKKFFTG